ncbi:MAG: hypothetical protein ACXWT3_10110 [Methylococcaceae bacterium]
MNIAITGIAKINNDDSAAILAKACFEGFLPKQAAKITRQPLPSAAPAVPYDYAQDRLCFTQLMPNKGHQSCSRNDSTRFRKACIFTSQTTLRENTCPIVSGD